MSWNWSTSNNSSSAWGTGWGSGCGNTAATARTPNNNTNFSWGATNDLSDGLTFNFGGDSNDIPCNYMINKNAETQTVVASKIDREYLCFGYGRKYYDKSIPIDILKVCLNMFGFDGFSWNVQHRYLNNNNYYETKIFCYDQIKFQIIIKEIETKSSGWSWGHSSQRLYFHIKLIDPKFNNKKIAKIIAFCSIHCKSLNIQFQSMINSSFDIIENGEILMELNDSVGFMVDEIKHFESVQFVGNLDISHIDILDTTTNILNIYHPNIKMNKRIDYKWTLNPSLSPLIKTYLSPSFDDNNNWNLQFTETNGWGYPFQLKLQLLSLPPQITCIYVVWRCLIECNGKTYTNAKMEQFKMNATNSCTHFNFDNNIFGIEDNQKLPHISFISCIEIIHAEKQNFMQQINRSYKNTKHSGWNWGGSANWNRNTISNEKLYRYGIYRGNNNNHNNHNNKNRLILQKQIKNVKQRNNNNNNNDDDDNDDNTSNIWSFNDNAQQNILYVDTSFVGNNVNDIDKELDINNNDIKEQEEIERDFGTDFVANTTKYIKEYDEEQKQEQKQTISKRRKSLNVELNMKQNENDFMGIDCSDYKWIEKTLNRLSMKNCKNILNVFKEHEVTDKRLSDLDCNDWKQLILQIGIRNEMKKLFKQKNEEENENKKWIISDSEL